MSLCALTFVTHERLSLEPYQTWQYCEVADIEPFQGQSDQIFQFSIIQNRVRIPILPPCELKGRLEGSRLSLSSPLAKRRTEKGNVWILPLPLVLPIKGPMKAERARAREHKEVCKRKAQKTGIFGPDFPSDARHLGPVWPPVWINVISRSRLPLSSPLSLPIYLSIYLSRSLSPPLSFPLLARFSSRLAFSYSSLLCLRTP